MRFVFKFKMHLSLFIIIGQKQIIFVFFGNIMIRYFLGEGSPINKFLRT